MQQYQTSGVCSQKILFDLDGKTVKNVKFIGGCHGNTQGIAALVDGMDATEVIARLRGIRCGFKSTSCPDQLANALEAALAKQQ